MGLMTLLLVGRLFSGWLRSSTSADANSSGVNERSLCGITITSSREKDCDAAVVAAVATNNTSSSSAGSRRNEKKRLSYNVRSRSHLQPARGHFFRKKKLTKNRAASSRLYWFALRNSCLPACLPSWKVEGCDYCRKKLRLTRCESSCQESSSTPLRTNQSNREGRMSSQCFCSCA